VAKTTSRVRTTPKSTTRKIPAAKVPGKPSTHIGTQSTAINLRIDAASRALIDRAAAVAGQTRTDFMLTSARAQAELVLLDKVYFALAEADWTALNAALAKPAPANASLKAAFAATPIWDRK